MVFPNRCVIAGVLGAVVNLRDPQIDKLHQYSRQTTLHDIAIDTAERLGSVGSYLVVIEPSWSLFLFLRSHLTGVVSALSSESTTKTASNFAGSVLLALRLIGWLAFGASDQLSPAL